MSDFCNETQGNIEPQNLKKLVQDAGSQCDVSINQVANLDNNFEPKENVGTQKSLVNVKADMGYFNCDCKSIPRPCISDLNNFRIVPVLSIPERVGLYHDYGKDNTFKQLEEQFGVTIWLDIKGNIFYSLDKGVTSTKVAYKNLEVLLNSLIKTRLSSHFYIFKNDKELMSYQNKIAKQEYKKTLENFKNLTRKKKKIPYAVYDAKTKVQATEVDVVHHYIVMEGLNVVDGARLYPYTNMGFVKGYNGLYNINLYHERYFVDLKKLEESITLQYIFYISGYDREKFKYIMSFLSEHVRRIVYKESNSLEHNAILVFVANQESGIDIFYKILGWLFGFEYCVNIDNDFFKEKDYFKKIDKKLVLFFNNIAINTVSDVDKLNFIEYIMKFIDTENLVNNYFSVKIVTSDTKEIPYKISYKYVTFDVPKDLKKDFYFITKDGNEEKYTKEELTEKIIRDSSNFFNYLLRFDPSQSYLFNDSNLLFVDANSIDKVELMSKAIIDGNVDYFNQIKNKNHKLFLELMSDYENGVIRQSNLLEYYNTINNNDRIACSRTLMKRLRKKSTFFNTENIVVKSKPIGKCFSFPKK